MQSTNPNQPTPGDFYMFEPDVESSRSVCGVQFTNKRQLLSPPRLILRPDEGGFPPLRELPLPILEPTAGPEPRDLEAGFSGYWLVSERLRKVMDSVDPNAFVFAETDYRLADGAVGPTFFLCDVVRAIDALDEEASQLNIIISDEFVEGKYYDLTGDVRLAFKKDVLGSAHVFRLPYHGMVFCDHVFKDAVEAAGIGGQGSSDGLWFDDVVNS